MAWIFPLPTPAAARCPHPSWGSGDRPDQWGRSCWNKRRISISTSWIYAVITVRRTEQSAGCGDACKGIHYFLSLATDPHIEAPLLWKAHLTHRGEFAAILGEVTRAKQITNISSPPYDNNYCRLQVNIPFHARDGGGSQLGREKLTISKIGQGLPDLF